MEKHIYENTEMEIIEFESDDIIVASPGEDDLPDIPDPYSSSY